MGDGTRATLRDIARKLNISTTTVTKALRALPRVSEETRQSVLRVAKEIGYRPNRSAQALVGSGVRLAAVYVSDSTEYIRYVEKGFDDALRELSDYGVRMDRYNIPNIYDADAMKSMLTMLESEKPDGLLLTPILHQPEYRDIVSRFISSGVPVFFIVQEMEEVQGAATLQVDWNTMGRMAAQMFNLALAEGSHVAVITTNKDFKAHVKCLQGFMDMLDKEKITDVRVFENQDNREITTLITRDIIENHPDISGIYVTSYNSVRVCRCIEDHGLTGKYAVIGQDLYPELGECIERGQLLATIFPNQYQLGYLAVKQMFDCICGMSVSRSTVITPQLVMQSNLDCYRDFCTEQTE